MTNDDKTSIEEKEKVQSFLKKIELISKIIGALSVPVIGIKVSAILHTNSEKKQKARLFEQAWKNWNA